ncbi:hypothetical protein BKA62DRAFT_719781 [Auriculariales sp. MPI-PUGE-AT-0066]|nr:hypothetical protein BKA62DRAFT_719781 [Auriculariales sp. MPI-PUGE-AT-0066]
MLDSATSPRTPLGLYWKPLLDDYGRASEHMWRLADSVFFYIQGTTGKKHGVDAQQMSWLFSVAALEDDKRVAARVANLHVYYNDIGIRYTTIKVDGKSMPTLDRQNWFAMMAWEVQVLPDYAFQWWDALIDRLPLEDPSTQCSFPTPPPRNVFPEIGDPALRPIAASFAAMIRLLARPEANLPTLPSDWYLPHQPTHSVSPRPAHTNPFLSPEDEDSETRPRMDPSRQSSQSIRFAVPLSSPAQPAHETPLRRSMTEARRLPPLPPRPKSQPYVSTEPTGTRTPDAGPSRTPDVRRVNRHSWSPGSVATRPQADTWQPMDLEALLRRPETVNATLRDTLPDAGHFVGLETMQTVVRRGLGPGTHNRRMSLMPVAAADEATLHPDYIDEVFAELRPHPRHPELGEEAAGITTELPRNRRPPAPVIEDRMLSQADLAQNKRSRGWFGALGRSRTKSSTAQLTD